MSVQFYKILLVVALGHILFFSFIWIGFSAPIPRPLAVYTYEGALPRESSASSETWQNGPQDKFILDHLGNHLDRWIKFRNLEKPRVRP